MIRRAARAFGAGVALALGVLPVAAQEKPQYLLTHSQTKEKGVAPASCPPATPAPDEPEAPPSEWDFRLRFGSMFQLSANSNVVGKSNGTTRSLGGDVHGEANWKRGQHEVKNRLDVNVVFIKTQNTSGWVSATDAFELENIYQYRALAWTGPFTRAGLNTSLFVGRDLRSNSVLYQRPDGTLSLPATELRLTDPFQPLTLLQTVGGFVNPVRAEEFDLDFRGGFGAREVFADGQLGVSDEDDTAGIVEIVELHSYAQAGLELIGMVRGMLFEKKLQYYFGGEFLLPILRSAPDERSALELLDKRIRLGVAYQLATWATLLYEIRLVHQPQLVDRYQIQNSFGFKASYSVR